MTNYEEGARQMLAAEQQYRIEAPGNGRMLLDLTDEQGRIAVYDLPLECMVSIGRDILRVYDLILNHAIDTAKSE